MNNKETVPMGLAVLLFAFLGLLILGTVVFAGINAFQLVFRQGNDAVAALADGGKHVSTAQIKAELVPEMAQLAYLADDSEIAGEQTGARPLAQPAPQATPRPGAKPMPTPEPTP
ncbi:MAG: hypothetical protein FWF77_01895, partial [Defluviitaleaceae bacterium]|nr:hypothetical protein [Defluviitaleaceae bacterium]